MASQACGPGLKKLPMSGRGAAANALSGFCPLGPQVIFWHSFISPGIKTLFEGKPIHLLLLARVRPRGRREVHKERKENALTQS